MDKIRKIIANWLGFSTTEANGFVILLPLLILLVISEPAYRTWLSSQPDDFSAERKALDSLTALWDIEQKKPTQAVEQKERKEARFFQFDPNKTGIEELESLGFSKHLSKRIANYRQKGGVFRIKRDLLNIYGMDSTLYHQLYAFIQLPENEIEEKKREPLYERQQHKLAKPFDINKADTTQLKTIYGIGTVLAARIIKFRESLGGFTEAGQLKEVYGVDSLAATRIKQISFIDETFEPRKLNINTTDEKSLSSHPYIKRSFARAILAYRFQHGDFSDVRDLLKIPVIPPQEAERLIPYLKVKD
jgi:DNA uptake protein ComE-like DNA-binding protein